MPVTTARSTLFRLKGDAARYAVPAVLAITVLGALLRALHIGEASLWNDELISRYYIETGLRFMWTRGFTLETTPPVYYTLLAGWVHLFGHSEAALRSLSAVVSTLAIPLVFLLGRELVGTGRGLLGALIFAIAPAELYYAQEARAYALMLIPVTLAMLGAARVLREPGEMPGERLGLVLYAVGAAFAIYVHTTSLLIIAALNLVVLTMLLRDGRPGRWARLWRWIAASAVVGVLSLPEVIASATEVHDHRLAWMQPITWRDMAVAWGSLVAGPAMHPMRYTIWMGLALLAVIILAAWRARPPSRVVALLLVLPLLDFALILLAGIRQPILVPRLLTWMGVPLSLVLAILLTRRTIVWPALAGIGGIALALGLQAQLTQGPSAKEPWRPLLAKIKPELAQADLVVVGPWTEPMGLDYYGYNTDKVRFWTEHFPPNTESTVIAKLTRAKDISRTALLDAIRSGQGVLLIQRDFERDWDGPLKTVQPPTKRVVAKCSNGGACLEAYYWAPAGKN